MIGDLEWYEAQQRDLEAQRQPGAGDGAGGGRKRGRWGAAEAAAEAPAADAYGGGDMQY
jgi:hypothetical protein